GAVDDAALVFAFADEVDDLLERLVFWDHAVSEVWAVEAGDERGGIVELEMFDDVIAHAARGGGGERHQRDLGEKAAEFREVAILGTEIVAPFGDAVCFVDGEAGDVPALQIFLPAVEHEALGGAVETLVFTAMQTAKTRA